MSQPQSLLDQWRSRVARCGWLARAELTDGGVTLGTRTILATSLHAHREETDHDRLVVLLAAAYRGHVDAATPARIAKALTLWRRGDKALAAIHLALARLPPIEPDDAYRLHLADLALDAGVAPEAVLRAFGHAEATARLFKYDQAEPRVPSGGPQGGEWAGAGEAGGAAPGHDAATQLAANTTTNFDYACKKLKLDPNEATLALHDAKHLAGLGGADNCTFDLRTGDILFNGESIGNLGD